jgi:SAM-dependent methyltransferase
VGIDISAPMLARARDRDPGGDYRLVSDADLTGLVAGSFDLVLSAFSFDNIPTMEKKVAILEGLRQCLGPRGRIVNLVSAPEIYVNEWVSFSTKDYPENRAARCGDKVRIVMLDVDDRRPVEDVLWTEEGYREVYERAAVRPIRIYRPLGNRLEPFPWTSEVNIAPWVIYVLEGIQ